MNMKTIIGNGNVQGIYPFHRKHSLTIGEKGRQADDGRQT